jgi:transcriptional regulator with XRE-family HTH domain
MWNQDLFVENVERLMIRKYGKINQSVLNKALNSRDAFTRWKKGDRPSLQILLQLTEVFNCTLDTLYLSESTVVKDDVYCYTEVNKEVHDDVEYILTQGGEDDRNALLSGMKGVKMSIKQKKDVDLHDVIRKMAQDIEDLKQHGGSGRPTIPFRKRATDAK